MWIVFDDIKRAISLDKHGLDMADFAEAFDFDTGRKFETYTSRTGRTRFALIGWMPQESQSSPHFQKQP